MNRQRLALQDLKKALLQYRVWIHLGWVEIKQRYRRSVIGPWWISLSMLVFIVMMGIVFSRLFGQRLDEYIPFFTAEYLFWIFISTSILESAEIFQSNSGYIKQISLPFSLYVFKHLVRNVICLLHNFVVYLVVCLFFKLNPGLPFLGIIPGLLLLCINLYWICMLVAMLCARFRDMIPMIGTSIQIAFFVTPISWMPKLLDNQSFILKLNPLVYLLYIVRSPLLGQVPQFNSILISSCLAIVGCGICFFFFSRSRARIPFWVD